MTEKTDVPDGYVLVSIKDFNRMEDDSMKLAALERGGVDNWEWYGESLTSYWEWKEEQEKEQEEAAKTK